MPNIAFCAPLQSLMWEGVRSSQKATRIYLYLSKFFMPKDKQQKKNQKKKKLQKNCVMLRTEIFSGVFFPQAPVYTF